ncbi:MAG: hypothetical protein ACE5D6_03325, partial [Candidatus Zixiibacteriota bacterium]
EVILIPLVKSGSEEFQSRFSSAAAAGKNLDLLSPGYGQANLGNALEEAVELLRNAVNLNKEIYLITDRQRTNLPEVNVLKNTDANIYLVELPLEKNDNLGITSIDFGGQIILPGHDFEITANVKNYSNVERHDIIASLFLDGNRTAQIDFKVPAGEETSVRFTRSVISTGFHSGYVELSDDKFPNDNRYYFSFRIPEHFNLLIIDGDQTGNLLSLAMVPSRTLNQYWSVKKTQPENLAGVNFWEYDVIILTGAPELAKTYFKRIKSFLSRGKAVFITYHSQTDINYFNDNWSEITGVIYDKPLDENFSRAGYYSFLTFDADHPIFSIFGFENNQPPEIKFYTLPSLHLINNTKTLLHFTGNRPALVESSYGNGTVLTFTGPIAPLYSDITSHAFFVPFISRIAEYLASDLSGYDLHLFCGDNISRSLTTNISLRSSLELLTPDSSQYALVPEEELGSLVLRVKQTDTPGIYRINYPGKEIDRFAVNINPEECNLSVIDTDQLASALGAEKINLLKQNVELASLISQFRYGKELWHLFLWLAAALLIIEMLLSKGSAPEEE